MVEDLNDLLTGNDFFNVTVSSTESRLLRAVIFSGSLGYCRAADSENRNKENCDKRKINVCSYHKHESAYERYHARNNGGERVVEHVVKAVNVVYKSGHNFTCGVIVEILYGELLKLQEKVASDFLDCALRYEHHNSRLKIGCENCHSVNDCKDYKRRRNVGKKFADSCVVSVANDYLNK